MQLRGPPVKKKPRHKEKPSSAGRRLPPQTGATCPRRGHWHRRLATDAARCRWRRPLSAGAPAPGGPGSTCPRPGSQWKPESTSLRLTQAEYRGPGPASSGGPPGPGARPVVARSGWQLALGLAESMAGPGDPQVGTACACCRGYSAGCDLKGDSAPTATTTVTVDDRDPCAPRAR